MSIGSPSLNAINNLIFGAGYDHHDVERAGDEGDEPEDELEPSNTEVLTSARTNNEQGVGWKRESMYVTLFEGGSLFATALFWFISEPPTYGGQTWYMMF
jgi:hypothetical protein